MGWRKQGLTSQGFATNSASLSCPVPSGLTRAGLITLSIYTKHSAFVAPQPPSFSGSGIAFNYVSSTQVQLADFSFVRHSVYWWYGYAPAGPIVTNLSEVVAESSMLAVAYTDDDDSNAAVFVNYSENSATTSSIPSAAQLTTQTRGILTTNCWYLGLATNPPSSGGWTHTASNPANSPQTSSLSLGFGTSGAPNLTSPADRWLLTGMSFRTVVPPVVTQVPIINGTPQVGIITTYVPSQGSNGSITGIQWLRNGSPISAATGSTYTPVALDESTSLSVRETWTNSDGSVYATSGGVTVGAAAVGNSWFAYVMSQGGI